MTMGSRICVMKDGLIQQVDTPKEIYNRPVNAFVAGFIGSPQMNFITGRVEETDALHFVFQDGERQFRLPLNPDPATKKALSAYAGKDVLAGIRPEHAQLAEKEHAHFEETVLVSEMLGSETYIHYHLQGKIHTLKSTPDTDIAIGDTIPIRVEPRRLHFFDDHRLVALEHHHVARLAVPLDQLLHRTAGFPHQRRGLEQHVRKLVGCVFAFARLTADGRCFVM